MVPKFLGIFAFPTIVTPKPEHTFLTRILVVQLLVAFLCLTMPQVRGSWFTRARSGSWRASRWRRRTAILTNYRNTTTPSSSHTLVNSYGLSIPSLFLTCSVAVGAFLFHFLSFVLSPSPSLSHGNRLDLSFSLFPTRFPRNLHRSSLSNFLSRSQLAAPSVTFAPWLASLFTHTYT